MVKAYCEEEMARFSGTLQLETGGYGFLMGVKALEDCPPPEVPLIDGKPGGIFVSASMARHSLGAKGSFDFAALNGKTFTFSVTPSMTHGGKAEAYGLKPLDPSTI